MKNQKTHLPIFPLPVFLLPEGITRLRIFEPRYLKMIRIAAQGQGFIISLIQRTTETEHNAWGSWVNIINFDQGKGGILEVDVQCKSLVEIHSINIDSNNLHHGYATPIEHWASVKSHTRVDELSIPLVNVIKNSPLLGELYEDVNKGNPHWVVARWLEILPVEHLAKSNFVDKSSYKQAKDFIEAIILKN
jgi:Lon protease-like protein